MNTEVVKVLKSWKSSLDHYEKLDDWKLSANLSVLGAYLRTKDENIGRGDRYLSYSSRHTQVPVPPSYCRAWHRVTEYVKTQEAPPVIQWNN